MVHDNRYGKTDYCACCGWKIDAIFHKRKNGTQKKKDWESRPLHKDCWRLVMRLMSLKIGDASVDKFIRYNSKCYNGFYDTSNVLNFFKRHTDECVEYVRGRKKHKINYVGLKQSSDPTGRTTTFRMVTDEEINNLQQLHEEEDSEEEV